MEAHLEGRDWLALDHATLADVVMYTYTAHAPKAACGWMTTRASAPGWRA